jgi:hypothetical protein
MAFLARCLDWLCGICASAAQDECVINQLISSVMRSRHTP